MRHAALLDVSCLVRQCVQGNAVGALNRLCRHALQFPARKHLCDSALGSVQLAYHQAQRWNWHWVTHRHYCKQGGSLLTVRTCCTVWRYHYAAGTGPLESRMGSGPLNTQTRQTE